MENTVLQHRNTPLASCEARARLALDRGEISQSTYLSLVGITAEAEALAPTTLTEEKRAEATEDEPHEPTPRQQITPCDTPPTTTTPWDRDELPADAAKLQLPQGYTTMDDGGGLKPRFSSASELQSAQEKYVAQKAAAASIAANGALAHEQKEEEERAERTQLDRMRAQGFGLSDRAQRHWRMQEEGVRIAHGSKQEEKSDTRLEQFVDICLTAYPPSAAPTKQSESASFRDLVWQNRIGLTNRPVYDPNSPNGPRDIADCARWEVRYEELLQFKSMYGHCDVPFRYDKSKSLGGWVQKMRDFNKRGKLTKNRHDRLSLAGFSWVLENKRLPKIKNDSIHSYDDLWDFRYNSLVDFKLSHGHCNVPYRWAKDPQLGRWVQNQREFYKRKTLSSERYGRLIQLGFLWAVRRGSARAMKQKEREQHYSTKDYTQSGVYSSNSRKTAEEQQESSFA